jgi:hypothetical protein
VRAHTPQTAKARSLKKWQMRESRNYSRWKSSNWRGDKKGFSSEWNSSQIVQKDWSKLRINSARNGSKSHWDPQRLDRSRSTSTLFVHGSFYVYTIRTIHVFARITGYGNVIGFKVGVGYLRVYPTNFTVSPSWLHMLGRGGIVGNQSDFYAIDIVDTLHYFEVVS